ncbi:response regulator receiver protein [Halalkalicoccus jeotgali B3]|uniref:Response regulator receiver protein n=1 Tax=Halalkalicoccus jeotgali (strain DSM 18796 / CECT 7217 / JCM 14584 / KCTC 4019 / B3) TaxID=795797 RepID=D8J411_HALJB|nr:response regulator receiver protein [Halalkalicoccus jeotgali B3]ELY35821.1 response regulator receiver protein [Halalkalicoccus jeotgali B3]
MVLVVDDEPQLAELFATWLDEEWTVRTANDGEEALALLDEGVAVALLDRRMPGMSGDEVLDEIHGTGYDCRTIMVTAVDPDFDIIEMGFDDYLVKPVSKEELTDTVEHVHRRSQYDEIMREYYSLASKRAVLETEKSAEELDGNEEFRELERRLTELRDAVDETVEELRTHEDFAAAFRDLDS